MVPHETQLQPSDYFAFGNMAGIGHRFFQGWGGVWWRRAEKCPNVIYGAHGIVYHLMYNKTTTTATAEQQR